MERDILEKFDPTNLSDKNYDQIDLHKNVVDQIVLVSDDGQPMYRESDLIDVWFDSGAMPYAQWHYPFENKAFIDNNDFYPADFIAEGVDQTRGWFYTLHVISSLVFGQVAYKNVISNGLVLDKFGKKMSKRMGNSVDPFKTLSTYGADATRWYMIGNTNPWDNLRFDVEGIEEVQRKFFGTLYNTYNFFALYANLDGFKPQQKDTVNLSTCTEIDRWILSELHTLIKKVTSFYEEYQPTKIVRAIEHFVTENLSNWFVRLNRRRFWKSGTQKDKLMVQQTLYTCLLEVSKLAAPVAPFFMDQLYKDLTGETSVHLASFPLFESTYVDALLEHRMQKAQKITSMALSLRKKEKIKVRQPLKGIMVPVMEQWERDDLEIVGDLICKEINVKKLDIITDSTLLVKKIQPNFRVLGPRFGKKMKIVGSKINDLNQQQINTIDTKGTLSLEVAGENVTILKEEVIINFKDIEGWVVASQSNLTVALDTTIDEELRKEGLIRELINRVQNIRKEMSLEVTDTITLSLSKEPLLEVAMSKYQNHFKTETLTKTVTFVDKIYDGLHIEFDNIQTNILISKTL